MCWLAAALPGPGAFPGEPLSCCPYSGTPAQGLVPSSWKSFTPLFSPAKIFRISEKFKPPYFYQPLIYLSSCKDILLLHLVRSLAHQRAAVTWISALRGFLLCSLGGYFQMRSKRGSPALSCSLTETGSAVLAGERIQVLLSPGRGKDVI